MEIKDQKTTSNLSLEKEISWGTKKRPAKKWIEKNRTKFSGAGGEVPWTTAKTKKFDISWKSGTRPKHIKAWEIPRSKEQEVYLVGEIERLESMGIVEKVDKDFAIIACSPLLVPKGDSWRLCINYKPLDKYTEKTRSQIIPNMWEGARELARCGSFFRKIDLKNAYWKIPMTEEAKRATCFHFRESYYAWNGMPFGPSEAPTFFNAAIAEWLKRLKSKNIVQYFDDFVVYGETMEECEELTNNFIEEIDKIGFIVHEDKSTWSPTKNIQFCGYEIEKGRIGIPSEVIERWKKMKKPEDVRKTQGQLARWSWFIKDKEKWNSPNLKPEDLPGMVEKWIEVEAENEELILFTDASSENKGTCGLKIMNRKGGVIMEKAWLLQKKWRSEVVPIWEKELRALSEGLEWIPSDLRNKIKEIKIDNKVAFAKIEKWRKNRRPLLETEHLICKIKRMVNKSRIRWIKSEENEADFLSRMDLKKERKKMD